ncbi:hypothetical protein BDR26DRAFT_971206 [Obelidium mucronatum]|nr:hypothetical protein BDR26DRAFT_971206 [Obelidium mucronatum]
MGGAASTARKEQEIEERRLVEEKSRLLLLQEQERERLRALEEAKEHKENELTPEQQELFEVSVEVNDAGFIASEPNSNGEAGSASMVVGGQHMPVNWNIIETDTFHTSSGKSFTCFQVESLEWYYVDWNKQVWCHLCSFKRIKSIEKKKNQAPAPIPDSWIRDGGYFLSKKRKDCGIGQRQLLPDTAASETEMTIDLPYLDIHTFPNSSHCYDPISNQMILWQQFPVVRHVRYSYDRKTCTWNPMSIELEQCIPEVRDAVLTIQNALRTTQHGGLEDPSREKIVQVLRDYSFDVEKTMQVLGADKARIKRSLSEESEQERLGYWESTPKNKSIDLDLEETADQFALTGKDDSAICLFPDEAAKSSTANTVNWRIGNLEKKLESSQETIAKLEQEKKELERLVLSLRLELAHQREENGQRDKALVETNAELLNQKDSFKRIESEYHSMRMTRLDVLPELSTRILQQKDVQIGKLACTVSNLHLRIDELENWRRKRSISSLTVIAELHKMRSEYSQFKMDTSALLRKLFRTSSEALKPIVERLLRAEERNRSTQDTLLVYSRTIRLLTNRVNNLRGGLESVCMVAGTVDRKSLVLPLGECGITIKAAEQKSINFLFDKVFFGPQDLYNGCVRQSVESCKDGVNFCVLVLGNDTSVRVNNLGKSDI